MSCKQGTSESGALSISFKKIYDNPLHITYSGLDVKETEDKGYIVLGEAGEAPYLLRINRYGEFMWNTLPEVVEDCQNAVPELLVLDKTTYVIFCIKQFEADWKPILLKFKESNGELENEKPIEIQLSPSLTFIKPLRASKLPGNKFLLMASDEFGGRIFVIKAAADGEVDWVKTYFVSSDCFYDYPPSDERIYVCGLSDTKDKFFFQTYNNASGKGKCFQTVLGDINSPGVEQVFTSESPFVAMEWYSTNPGDWRFSGFSVSRESRETIKFINQAVDVNNISHLENEDGIPSADINITKKMFIHTIKFDDENILFWGFNSNTNEVVLNAFDMKSNFRGWDYYGSTQVYELRGLLGTSDGGLVLLGDTTVISRMHRIFLIKLSREELIAMKNQYQP
jgi:hypothetical protein